MVRADMILVALFVGAAMLGSDRAYCQGIGAKVSKDGARSADAAQEEAAEEASEEDWEERSEEGEQAGNGREESGEKGLVIKYEAPKSTRLKAIATLIEKSEVFKEVAGSLNESYAVPRIEAIFGECEAINAFYLKGQGKIVMCYDLFKYLQDNFAEDDSLSEEEVMTKVMNAMIFIFFHELGHAFADVLQLPITGREEDAADDLATLVFLEAEEDDDGESLIAAIEFFWLNAETSLQESAVWGEHSLNKQRIARMMCLAYGSDQEKFSDWVGGEDGVPEDRAPKCKDEYEVMSRGWNTLLEPYTKEEEA